MGPPAVGVQTTTQHGLDHRGQEMFGGQLGFLIMTIPIRTRFLRAKRCGYSSTLLCVNFYLSETTYLSVRYFMAGTAAALGCLFWLGCFFTSRRLTLIQNMPALQCQTQHSCQVSAKRQDEAVRPVQEHQSLLHVAQESQAHHS